MRKVIIIVEAEVNDTMAEKVTSPEMMDLVRNWIWEEKKLNAAVDGKVNTARVEFD